MPPETLPILRRPERLVSDDKRVITRYLDFRSTRRIRSILRRLVKIKDADVVPLLDEVRDAFSTRHRDLESGFRENFARVYGLLPKNVELSDDKKLLIGAYFTLEYSIESAALFNPSIVIHPDQTNLPEGSLRFLLSLRATGEGHVSSIVFRRGEIDASGDVHVVPPPRFAYRARPAREKMFEKAWFMSKLAEMGLCDNIALRVLSALPDPFDADDLLQAINANKPASERPAAFRTTAKGMLWLARANYDVRFPSDCYPSEIVIFPATESERHGMEDLRLTRFVDYNGDVTYYGTYTAAGAASTLPMLLRTTNFTEFSVRTMGGRHVKNKGMALFPRRVDGKFMMIGRHDGEKLWLLESDSLYTWNNAKRLQTPRENWELVQIGNCGSPIETDAGWLLLTHGVGPVRRYCIGALLLDRKNPARVIGRLRDPLMVPAADEREGYVPNVVYSCGSLIHNGQLVIPYAMSDQAAGFAIVSADELLDRLIQLGP